MMMLETLEPNDADLRTRRNNRECQMAEAVGSRLIKQYIRLDDRDMTAINNRVGRIDVDLTAETPLILTALTNSEAELNRELNQQCLALFIKSLEYQAVRVAWQQLKHNNEEITQQNCYNVWHTAISTLPPEISRQYDRIMFANYRANWGAIKLFQGRLLHSTTVRNQ
jgi:transposase